MYIYPYVENTLRGINLAILQQYKWAYDGDIAIVDHHYLQHLDDFLLHLIGPRILHLAA